jgi:drug/metabolite transporter (DMT)-like permease
MTRDRSKPGFLATATLSAITLVAFAANSLLCRGALGPAAIDPIGFTLLRLVSGAVTLLIVVRLLGLSAARAGSWAGGVTLFLYAIAFSFAYVSVDAGTGALILFAAVQATMIGVGIKRGERPSLLQWSGLALAMSGLVYLLRPGQVAPDPAGALLMGVAGVSWGIYSVLGRGEKHPVAATAGNFARAVPFIAIVALIGFPRLFFTERGVSLAVSSGAVASGLGYVLWYAALRGLSHTQAAVMQLAVPLLAAFGGAALLAETPTLRLWVASAMILGGVGLAIASPKPA